MIRSILDNHAVKHTVKTAKRLLHYRHLLAPLGRTPEKKFVILMYARSGSTLLVDLLNQSPDIRCDGEILGAKVPSPRLFLDARGKKSGKAIYGFKMTAWQIISKQKLASPKAFMLGLHDQGWHIVYLKRNNVLRQAISFLTVKHKQAQGHNKRGFHHRASQGPLRLDKIHVDCGHLLRIMGTREKAIRGTEEALRGLPHLAFVYEDDLLRPEDQQRTADKIFDYLGAERVTVTTELTKISKDRLADMIDNYDEVVSVLADTKYAAMLDDHSQESTLQVA